MNWLPNDDIYPGYSLYNDLGYGPEGERNLIVKILNKYNIKISDQNIKSVIEITKDLMLVINDECKEEISEYYSYLKLNFFIGITIPIELLISKMIVTFIIDAIGYGIEKIYKKIKDYIKKKIYEKNIQEDIEELEIIYKVVKKIDQKQSVIEKLEYSIKKIELKE